MISGSVLLLLDTFSACLFLPLKALTFFHHTYSSNELVVSVKVSPRTIFGLHDNLPGPDTRELKFIQFTRLRGVIGC